MNASRKPKTCPIVYNPANKDGARWVERPNLGGLRFVGFADELTDSRTIKCGWYLHPNGEPGECARGVVYQLPARAGESLLIPGLQLGEWTRKGWQEQSTLGTVKQWQVPALLWFKDRIYGERGEAEEVQQRDSNLLREAARAADRLAEVYAERAREDNEAWQAGADWRESVSEARRLRKEARSLAKLAAKQPENRELLQRLARKHWNEAQEETAKAEALKENHGNHEQFKEGAGA